MSFNSWVDRHTSWALVLPFCVLAVACQGGGGDSDNFDHKCLINYNSPWLQTNLRLNHTDPRHCPIPIANHVRPNDDVYFSADVEDPGADDAEDFVYLDISNSVGSIVESAFDVFLSNGATSYATVSATYRAATGTFSGGSPNDRGFVQVPLKNASTAEATVRLDVLFGTRSTLVTGYRVVPAYGTGCSFSATSYLDETPREGMRNSWYVDGQYKDGDPLDLRLLDPGEHSVEVRSEDEFGYVTQNGMAVNASYDASECTP